MPSTIKRKIARALERDIAAFEEYNKYLAEVLDPTSSEPSSPASSSSSSPSRSQSPSASLPTALPPSLPTTSGSQTPTSRIRPSAAPFIAEGELPDILPDIRASLLDEAQSGLQELNWLWNRPKKMDDEFGNQIELKIRVWY